jgi:hypothetical protein
MIDAIEGAPVAGAGEYRKKKTAADDPEPVAGATGYQNLSVVDKPWNATAAIKRVRTKTGSTEKPSASYKNAFFWYDAADKENFGAYKLPFVDVVDGKMVAIRRGVFAAKGAMAGARGNKPNIPAADVAAVNGHIDKYVKKIENEDQEKNSTAGPAETGGKKQMKYADLKESDPELLAEVDGMIVTARAEGSGESKTLIDAVAPVLTGDEPQYVKDLAVKVLKGEATLEEMNGARAALAAISEEEKAKAAAKETQTQEPTPPEPPAVKEYDGEIKTEEDHQAAVARVRANRGQEAN